MPMGHAQPGPLYKGQYELQALKKLSMMIVILAKYPTYHISDCNKGCLPRIISLLPNSC